MLATTMPTERLPIIKTHNPFKVTGVDTRSEAGRRSRDLAGLSIVDHGPDLDRGNVRDASGEGCRATPQGGKWPARTAINVMTMLLAE